MKFQVAFSAAAQSRRSSNAALRLPPDCLQDLTISGFPERRLQIFRARLTVGPGEHDREYNKYGQHYGAHHHCFERHSNPPV
jgi:hypothetical protein